MFCKYCGVEIDEGSVFCSNCGKSQNDTQEIKEDKKTKKSKKLILYIVPVVVIAIITVIALFLHMTGITVISKTVEAGSIVNTKDIVKAKSSSATISISGNIDTSKPGDYVINCKISNGLFNANKSLTISVVDTTAPIIEGPESITVIWGQDFLPEDYYSVTDFEEKLESKIIVTPEINTNAEGKREVELSVSDSSGNTGTLAVSVKVLRLTKNEEMALLAINQYIADGNSSSDVKSSVWVLKASGGTNGVDYYVEVANNILYAIYNSGTVKEFTELDCGGSDLYGLMVYAVEYEGTLVSTSKLIN